MNPATQVRTLLAEAEQQLQQIATARLDAEVLLAACMQTNRARLYAYPEQEVTAEIAGNFQLLVSKRINNYPVAYLIGKREFWSLDLKVDKHTLIPRTETETLVETALELIPIDKACEILELGTGNGAIALAVSSERPCAQVLAVDISQDALNVARENAVLHSAENIDFTRSDWFSELGGRHFDLIISNPPYVESSDQGFYSSEIRYEPRLALDGGHHGLQAITHLIAAATHFLKPGAHLVLEHGYQQAIAINQLFAAERYRKVNCRQDFAGLDRVSFAQWP